MEHENRFKNRVIAITTAITLTIPVLLLGLAGWVIEGGMLYWIWGKLGMKYDGSPRDEAILAATVIFLSAPIVAIVDVALWKWVFK